MPAPAFESRTVTIASGAAVSSTIEHKGMARGAYQLPAAFTGTGMTFEVSNNATTWAALKNSAGTSVSSVTVAADSVLPFPTEVFNFRYFRLKSGSNEAADRSIAVFMSN